MTTAENTVEQYSQLGFPVPQGVLLQLPGGTWEGWRTNLEKIEITISLKKKNLHLESAVTTALRLR